MLKSLEKKKFYVAPTGCVSEKRETGRATPVAARFRVSWVRREVGYIVGHCGCSWENMIPANWQNLQIINDSAGCEKAIYRSRIYTFHV